MYNALIIGAGQIAGGFDEIDSASILTHAHAYTKNENINLLGFYDIDYSKAEQMAKKWNTKAYKSLDEVKNVDIISICTPDEYHVASVVEAQKLNPKVIFLEKPVCTKKEDVEILRTIKTPILVNYSRAYSKDFQNLARMIKNNEFGKYQCGSAFYTKGFIHNGSHMLNLLNLLIGKIKQTDIFDEISDFYENDKTKSAVLTFENDKKVVLNGCDCRNYTIFECDLIFEKARIRILNSGFDIEISTIVESEKFKGYKNLKIKETLKTDLDLAMANAIENMTEFLDGKSNLLCTLEDGFEAINYG